MKMEFDPQQPVSVTLLGSGENHTVLAARIVSTSGRRMTLVCDLAAPPGAPVKVETPEYLVLAEILSVQNTHDTEATAVLRIRHALKNRDIDQVRQKWV
jgi:xanthine/CO dehydrogenase XdhC/CoxF family maturation factor